MPKCIICEKDFVVRPSGKQGGANRQICYDCLPEDIGSHQERNKATKFLISQKLEKEKVNRGCDICGYNACGAALDWHHPNDDKEFTPSRIAVCNRETLNQYYAETQKCQLLCANCHREIHHKSYWTDFTMPIGNNYSENLRKEVCDYYKENLNIRKTSVHFHKSPDAIKNILIYCNIPIATDNNCKAVNMINAKTNEVIQTFASLSEASEFLNKGENGIAGISKVCYGKRKTAYGYKWCFK